MDMNEIKEIFFQECEEQLAELESGLLRLNDGDTDPETVNAVFRAVHSIKGGAGAFGLDDLVAHHALQNLVWSSKPSGLKVKSFRARTSARESARARGATK